MKRIQISKALLLSVLVCPAVFADIHDRIEYKINRVLRDVEIINNEIFPTECRVITEQDFKDADGLVSQTFTISEPGKYCFGETINWNPQDRQQSAIVIDASNVALNLNGYELKQVNDEGRATGIFVTTGHTTVKIANGAVRDFTQLGIVVEGGNSNIFLGNEDTILKVTGCGYGSTFSFFDDVDEVTILQGGILLGQTKAMAAQGYYTYQGPIDTAVLNNVFAEQNGPIGMYLGIGSDVLVNNSFFCRNADDRLAGYSNPFASGSGLENNTIVMGICYAGTADYGDVDSNNFNFTNSHFDENVATGETPVTYGINAAYNINGLILRKCTFNANKGIGATNTNGFGIYGCLLAGNKAVLLEDCQANNNFSEYFTEGYHYSGRNLAFDPETMTQGEGLVYRRCNANRNIASGTLGFSGVVGFELDFMLGLTVEQCTSLNNIAITSDPSTYALVEGIILFGSASLNGPLNSISVSGCHIAGNSVDAPNGGNIEGILVLSNFSNVVISDCIIQDNVGAGFDLGIWVQAFNSDLHNVVVQNCTIESENYGIYSNGDNNSIYQNNTITNVDNGIILDGSSCNAITDNIVTNATIGYEDVGTSTANPSTSLFANNRAFGVTTPFIVEYAFGPVPEVTGSLATGFPTGAQVFDNVSVANPYCVRTVRSADEERHEALHERVEKAREAREGRLNRLGDR